MLRPMMLAPMLSKAWVRKSLSSPSTPPSLPIIVAKYRVTCAHRIRRSPSLPNGASSAWSLAAENPSNERGIKRAARWDEGAARRRALFQLLASHAEVEAVGTLAPVFGGTEPALAVLRLGEIAVDLGWGGRIATLQREGIVDQGLFCFHRRLRFSTASSSARKSPRRSTRLANTP